MRLRPNIMNIGNKIQDSRLSCNDGVALVNGEQCSFFPPQSYVMTPILKGPTNLNMGMNHLRIFLFLSLMIIHYTLCAQDVVLNSQADVDAFEASTTTIVGNLTIEGNDITDLINLSNLTSVSGYLDIRYNDALTNVDSLANLTSVGGYLQVYSNNALTNIDGLANITSVGSDLYIYNNDALPHLNGLINITSVGGFLGINGNDALTNLNGLANITSVGGDLDIKKQLCLNES